MKPPYQTQTPEGAKLLGWSRFNSVGVIALLLAAVYPGCSSKQSTPNGPSGPVPLAVSSITPPRHATGVNVGTTVTASFSRDLNPATVTGTTFFVTGVSGGVSVSGNTATFTPSSPLEEGTDYVVNITTDVKDQTGVAMASQYTSNFTTGVVAAADAGTDRDASRGETVALVGSSSAAGTVTYLWDQVAGPDVGALSGQTAVFTAPDTVSTLIFTLRVDNGSGPSAPDSVVVWVLEDRSNTCWVSPTGSDTSAGTRSEPMLTIQAAVDKARTALKGGDVYVAAGTYTGSISLAPNVSLYGGYDPMTWLRDMGAQVTSIWGGTVAISGVEAHNLVLDGLRIQSADATLPGESSIGVSFTSSQGVVITHNVLDAGHGAPGSPGVQPVQPTKRSSGGAGDAAGDCIPANAGGAGAGASGRRGGAGGTGGALGGFDGSGGEGPCGNGGTGGLAQNGNLGESGCLGADGDSASAVGPAFGGILTGAYVTANGAAGGRAADGGGGGGGGGGAGALFGCGAGGGGGGEGGLGGGGGASGQGGGASIGLVLSNNSSATVVDNIITTSAGGVGGHGGKGGAGGWGGDGGTGGGESTFGWRGGHGGPGGTGGVGGTGSGGGGGPSVGIAEQGSTSFQDRLTFQLGTPGPGGIRPDGRGRAGLAGEQAEVKKLP